MQTSAFMTFSMSKLVTSLPFSAFTHQEGSCHLLVCSSTCYNAADKQSKQPRTVCSSTMVTWHKTLWCWGCVFDRVRHCCFMHIFPSGSIPWGVAPRTVCRGNFKNQNPNIDNLSPLCSVLGSKVTTAVPQLTWQNDSRCSGTRWYTVFKPCLHHFH